jgi:hypothetical protein
MNQSHVPPLLFAINVEICVVESQITHLAYIEKLQAGFKALVSHIVAYPSTPSNTIASSTIVTPPLTVPLYEEFNNLS